MEDFHLDLPSILKGSLYHQLCVPSNDIDDTKLTGFVSLYVFIIISYLVSNNDCALNQ